MCAYVQVRVLVRVRLQVCMCVCVRVSLCRYNLDRFFIPDLHLNAVIGNRFISKLILLKLLYVTLRLQL